MILQGSSLLWHSYVSVRWLGGELGLIVFLDCLLRWSSVPLHLSWRSSFVMSTMSIVCVASWVLCVRSPQLQSILISLGKRLSNLEAASLMMILCCSSSSMGWNVKCNCMYDWRSQRRSLLLNLPPNKPIQHYTSLTTNDQLLTGRLHSPTPALYPWSLAFRIKPARGRLSFAIAVASQDTSKGTAGSIWLSNRQSGQAAVVVTDMERPTTNIKLIRSQKTDCGAVVRVCNFIEPEFTDDSRGCAYGKSTLARW